MFGRELGGNELFFLILFWKLYRVIFVIFLVKVIIEFCLGLWEGIIDIILFFNGMLIFCCKKNMWNGIDVCV